MSYDDDYGDDGYDMDYDETREYVRKVKDQLKGVKLTDAQIIRKLEATNYDIKKTVQQLKPKDTKPTPSAKPAGSTSIGTAATASKVPLTKPTTASLVPPPPPSQSPTVAKSSKALSDGGNVEPEALSGKGDVALSDDENVVAGGSTAAAGGTSAQGPPTLTMVVTGHVDAGKSTLVGHLLYKCGQVTQRTMHKYEKDSQTIGKASFALAWVTDESQAEREHGVTIDVAERILRTENRLVTILDTPGHRDFVPNMIKGAAQADVALLVVPASEGEFESSMKDNAQTREHATLLKALGVSQIIVVVNKMDNTNPAPWSQDRYLSIEGSMRALLCSEMGYPDRLVRFVPLSGLSGDNIVSVGDACPLKAWYSGPTLQQAIDSFLVPPRGAQKALRAVVREVTSVDAAHGRIELEVSVLQGKLTQDRTVAFYSNTSGAAVGKEASAKEGADAPDAALSSPHVAAKYLVMKCAILGSSAELTAGAGAGAGTGAGDRTTAAPTVLLAGERGRIALINKGLKGTDLGVREGAVLFKGPGVPSMCRSFKASISTLADMYPAIIPGTCFELYLYGTEVQCHVSKLHSMVSAGKTAEEGGIVKNPKCIPASTHAIVSISLDTPVLVEPTSGCRALARFALRALGKTVAVGTCEKLL